MATVKDRVESAPAEAEEDVSSTLPTLNAPNPHHHPPPRSIPLTHTTAHTHTQDDNILDTWVDFKTDESESEDVEEQPESVHCVCGVDVTLCMSLGTIGVINLGV